MERKIKIKDYWLEKQNKEKTIKQKMTNKQTTTIKTNKQTKTT